MDKMMASFASGSTRDDAWVPFEYPQDGAMHVYGEIVPMRMQGSGGRTLAVGLWRCNELGTSPVYKSELGDETFLVLEGEVTIAVLATGESFTYRPGDVGSWSKGTPTRWTVHSPFKKFYVVADP
jgi:uncharacterized cupin superfamily protein